MLDIRGFSAGRFYRCRGSTRITQVCSSIRLIQRYATFISSERLSDPRTRSWRAATRASSHPDDLQAMKPLAECMPQTLQPRSRLYRSRFLQPNIHQSVPSTCSINSLSVSIEKKNVKKRDKERESSRETHTEKHKTHRRRVKRCAPPSALCVCVCFTD